MRFFVAALAALLLVPATASAHPLGNFSVNHLARISVSADRVDVRYILDAAEIPTLQKSIADPRTEVARELELTVDGRAVALTPGRETRANPARPGRAEDDPRGAPAQRAGDESRARSSSQTAPTTAASAGRRSSPRPATAPPCARAPPRAIPPTACAATPRTCWRARRTCAARASPSPPATARSTRPARAPATATPPATGFESILDGEQVLLLLLVAAFGWGAVHALSPGHGKAMVAAYLVGTRASRATPSRSAGS